MPKITQKSLKTVETGIQLYFFWTPACAGVTKGLMMTISLKAYTVVS